jgi:diguanylate cyclase (GGDEF)-like protein
VCLDCGDGHDRDFILRRAPYHGAHEPAEGLVGVLTDITDRKRMEEELRRTSQRDALTGLANRRTFEERLQTEWSRAARASRPLSLIMVDIDHFKEFNDLHGHVQGDECLRRVAEVIESTFRRSGELTSRWGGEEFAIVLAEVDRRDAIALAERLRKAVEDAAIPRRGRSSRVTVSVGVASLLPSPGGHPLHLVSLADEAMYRSKRQGRNRVTVSSEAAVF